MKFSFCTTCMNRTEYLKETIFNNLFYIHLFNTHQTKHTFEMSLYNYDSKDDMHEFIMYHFNNYIESKELIYTKVENKEIFHVAHAKNIAHKQSTGDVLINIDADNTINKVFIDYIIKLFEENMNYVTMGNQDESEIVGIYGRIAISRENFYKLGGYNEDLKGYGGEDFGLFNRAIQFLNCTLIKLNPDILNVLYHNNEIRFKNDIAISGDVDIDRIRIISQCIKNESIENLYINNGIINPNKYNNIIFGKI